jgi:membrane protease YdiL (CAAX protease family)
MTAKAAHSALKKPGAAPKPRPRQAPVKPWTWLDVVWVSVALVISSGLTMVVLGNRLTGLLPEVGQVGVRVALLVVFYLFELVVLAYLAHRRELPFRMALRLTVGVTSSSPAKPAASTSRAGDEDIAPTFAPWLSSLLVFALFFGLRGLVIGYNALTTAQGWPAPSSESMTSLFGTSAFGLIGATATVVLLAPFIEELVFRVVMQETFAKKLPLSAAVIAQSAIFAVYHLSLWAAVPNVLLALATGWLASRSKTIWPAVILHVLYNAAVVAAAFYLAFVPK